VRAEKHADGNREDQPDFLIVCERDDLLCEHKLDASLGERQLERYLAFARKRGRHTKLAFISASTSELSDEVVTATDYLRPRNTRLPYFRWEELYPLVEKRQERIAREFAAYMASIGLRPCNDGNWSDLFQNPERQLAFAAHWRDTERFFKDKGLRTFVGRSRSPGMEVIGATPWLRQFYLKPVARPASATTTAEGPFISACVAVRTGGDQLEAFAGAEGLLERDPSVLSCPGPLKGFARSDEYVWCREYLQPLDQVLSDDSLVMRQNLLDFAKAAFDDAEQRGARVSAG
jgi:hypothetical protein